MPPKRKGSLSLVPMSRLEKRQKPGEARTLQALLKREIAGRTKEDFDNQLFSRVPTTIYEDSELIANNEGHTMFVEMSQMRADTAQLTYDVARMKNNEARVNRHVHQVEGEIDWLIEDRARLREDLDRTDKDNAWMKNKMHRMDTDAKWMKDQIGWTQGQIGRMDTDAKWMKDQIGWTQGQIDRMDTDAKWMKDQIGRTQSQIDQMEDEKARTMNEMAQIKENLSMLNRKAIDFRKFILNEWSGTHVTANARDARNASAHGGDVLQDIQAIESEDPWTAGPWLQAFQNVYGAPYEDCKNAFKVRRPESAHNRLVKVLDTHANVTVLNKWQGRERETSRDEIIRDCLRIINQWLSDPSLDLFEMVPMVHLYNGVIQKYCA